MWYMSKKKFPTLKVVRSTGVDGRLRLEIELISITKSIGEQYWLYILLPDEKIIEGRLSDVDLKGMKCNFTSEIAGIDIEIKPGIYEYLDGYWGERAAIVLDSRRIWNKVFFKPRDAIKTMLQSGDQKLVKDGWDHEHCCVCWATISRNEQSCYMVSDKKDCLCLSCYENYVAKKDLSFVNVEQI